jgi:PAS domain S-box-containing protein
MERRVKEAKNLPLRPESAFQNFFENTLEGIFQTSTDGKLLAANPALARIFGYSSPRALLDQVNNVAKQVYVDPKRRSTFLRVMKKKGSIANFESQIFKKDGSTIWIKENVWSVKNATGDILYFEGTVHDISHRKKVEETKEKLMHEKVAREEAEKVKERVSKLYQKAREGIRARDEFLNIASHELRTPLTSLQLQIQLLKRMSHKNKDEAIFHETLCASELQIARLAKLINNLLDVSRIGNKKLVLEKEETSLPEVVEEVLFRFDNAVKASGSQISFTNGKSIIGKWDKSKIDQVITNLIANAIKYGQGRPIFVKADKKNSRAELTVQDQGIGIQKEDIDRVFDRFTRADIAKKYGGLGLGLYITKQIILAHGGDISVQSQPKKGTVFTVRLPLN